MSSEIDEEPGPDADMAIRYYQFLACAGLVVLGLALFELAATAALFPLAFGAMGILPSLVPPEGTGGQLAKKIPVRVAPLAVLLTVVIIEVLFGYSLVDGRELFALSDLMTAVGLISYLAGQYRIMGMRHEAVPRDARPRPDRNEGDLPETWPIRLAGIPGLKWLGVVLPLAVLAGQLEWRWINGGEGYQSFQTLSRERAPLERVPIQRPEAEEAPTPMEHGTFPTSEVQAVPMQRYDLGVGAWRFASLIWFMGVGAILLVSAIGTLRIYRMTPDEARMLGQDILWAETRGEQRRDARWMAWARRKWFRKMGQQP